MYEKIKGFVADGKAVSPDHWKGSCMGSTLNSQKIKAKSADMHRFSLLQEVQQRSWKRNSAENESHKIHMVPYKGWLQVRER